MSIGPVLNWPIIKIGVNTAFEEILALTRARNIASSKSIIVQTKM